MQIDNSFDQMRFLKLLRLLLKTWLCVNDLIDYSVEYEAEQKMFIVQNFYEQLYREQSKFEL